MNKMLIETLPFTAKLVEEATDSKRMVVEGVFQRAGVKNANGRIYPKSIWEKIIKDEKINQAMQERRMLGCLDHPEDGKSRLSRAAHIILSQNMDENGNIIGRAEILETPDGKVLQELFRAGVTVGISSRGSGTVKKNSLGEDVVNDDFALETYDFVYNPSTLGAYPKVVTEETLDNITEENSMNAKEKYTSLEAKAQPILSVKPSTDAASCQVVEAAAADLVMELTKLVTEAPEVKDLAGALMTELIAKRKEIRESYTVGSADQGVRRFTPMEAPPPTGEGWPINPGDAGPLADQVGHGAEFMKGGSPSVLGEASENPFAKAKESEKEDDEEDEKEEKDEKDESAADVLASLAEELVSMEETEDNSVARAFAAAYLLENYHRTNENETFNAVITRMQEKIQEAVKTGSLQISGENTELVEKYEVALGVIEELSDRLRLLSAKVYAEQELDKVGLKGDKDARKVVIEAIKKSPTKKSIDEAILALVPVKGMKAPEKKLTEETKEVKELPLDENKVEGKIAKLNEIKEKSAGPDLAKRLIEGLSFSRSNKK